MSTGRTLHLRIGFRFGSRSREEICSRARFLLGEAERLDSRGPMPLYWSFAVQSLLEEQARKEADLSALIAAIKERMPQDQIVPSGFAGVPHPLLLPEELKAELLWCYRNPWFPALEKLFEAKPGAILPVYPDLLAEAARGAYSSLGFHTIGFPIPLYRLLPKPGGRHAAVKPFSSPVYTISESQYHIEIRPVAVVNPGELNPAMIAALLASCGKADTLHVVIDGDGESGPAEAGILGRLFAMISRHRPIDFHPFSQQIRGAAPPVAPDLLLEYAEPYGYRGENNLWDRLESLRRKKRRSNLELRNVLTTLTAAATDRTAGVPEQASGHTLQISNMSMGGLVTLVGAELQATFVEGRLSNLIDRRGELLPGVPARSFFALDARKEVLQTDTAFSFEREGRNGLRSVLSTLIGRKPLQVITEYSFAEGQPQLALEVTVLYPPLSSAIARQSAPLELCLCSFAEDESPLLEAELPDRSSYGRHVPCRRTVIRLYGKIFKITSGGRTLELEASPSHKTRTELLDFRVCRRRGRYLLWANLGGSYLPQPVELLGSGTHRLSYSIRPGGSRR